MWGKSKLGERDQNKGAVSFLKRIKYFWITVTKHFGISLFNGNTTKLVSNLSALVNGILKQEAL
jgi:hypothetical protein